MNYVDLDLIKEWYHDKEVYMTLGNLLRYAANKDVVDIYVPLPEYVDMIFNSDLKLVEGIVDENERPTISICGIKITALLKEDYAKYKILK